MSLYHCENPALHSVLQFNCPCYNKQRIMSPSTGEVPKNRNDDKILPHSRFESTRDIYQKEMMKMRRMQQNDIKNKKDIVYSADFTADWIGWHRHVWSSKNFSGGNVGPFNMTVNYSDNIAGYQISDTFVKRISTIVTQDQGLCISLPHKLKAGQTSFNNGAYVSFEFSGNPTAVQFAILSPTIDVGRKDAVKIFCNDKPIVTGEYYYGDSIKFTGNTFLATKKTPDYIGQSDILIKVVKEEKIKTLKIEFSNLDEDPHGGRLALTDILVK